MTAEALPGRSERAGNRRPAHAASRTSHRRQGPVPQRPGALRRRGLLPWLGLAARAVTCAACLAVAVIAAKAEMMFRGMEAQLAGHVIGFVTRMQAGSSPGVAVIWFSPDKHSNIGLQVTPECTVALLTIPFLLATAALVWVRPRPVWPVAGLAIAFVLLLAMNQVRLLTIAWLVKAMGFGSGFYWGHTIIGSVITICGLAVVLAIFAMVAIRKGKLAR